MDWQIDKNGVARTWFPLVRTDFRIVWKCKIHWLLQWFLHLEPSKNGSDPDLARSGLFKIMLPTQAGSTFSISSPIHVDANALSSCLSHYMGLSEFALSLVTCAQLSSWARTANTHGNIGCALYASTAAQNTPEQVKEAQIQPRASQIQPRAALIKPKPSQIKAKPAKIKSRTTQISKYQANSNRHHQLADLDEHTIFAGHFHTIANQK